MTKVYIIEIFLFKMSLCQLLYPPLENISLLKPLTIQPSGSTCGLEVKDTLCSNLILDDSNTVCSNVSNLFKCDQSCPYGNVLTGLEKLKTLNVELTNPCEVVKDYVMLVKNAKMNNQSLSSCSYYFDPISSSECNINGRVVNWKPFNLETSQVIPTISFYNSRTPSILQSGLTLTLWFRQTNLNNG